jgi:hypothetical protein
MDGDGVERYRYCAPQFPRSARVKKGDLSRFVEEAVKWRVFNETLTEVREKFTDLPPDELQAMIDEVCASVRAERFPPAPKPSET